MSKPEKVTSARVDADGLDLRVALFTRHFLISGNATDAAKRAGFKGEPAVIGSRLLKKPEVAAVIKRERKRMLTELNVTSERTLRELVFLAFFDPRRLFLPDGNSLRPITQLDEATAAAISSFDFRRTAKKGLISRVRWANKLDALRLVGEYLNMWKGGNENDGDRLNEVIDAIRGAGKPKREKEKNNDDADDES